MELIFGYFLRMVFYSAAGAFVYIFIRMSVLCRRKRKFRLREELTKTLLFAYCAGIVSQTLLPRFYLGLDQDTGNFYFHVRELKTVGRVNLLPFKTIRSYLKYIRSAPALSMVNLLGNILVFCPFGILLPLTYPKIFGKAGILVPTGFFISLAIETTQIFVGRSFDLDDIILNGLGVWLGFLLYRAMSVRIRPGRSENGAA